jgi:Flp pilus assembly protein TadB
MGDLYFFEVLGGIAVCLLVLGVTWQAGARADLPGDPQLRPRSLGNAGVLADFALAGQRKAAEKSAANARYLKLLKHANWYWALGEPAAPVPGAPFWNLETLWGEKLIGAAAYAAGGLLGMFGLLWFGALVDGASALLSSAAMAAVLGYVGYTGPDSALAAAARRRQKLIGLEMGYRLPEMRSDVLAGRTVMSALRELSRRPGGPFIEELRRVVLAFDVLKDESGALALMLDRNAGNEMMSEFVNQMTMAIVHGNEVNRVLHVLASAAQQRLLQQVTAQGRHNAQEMGRPLAAGSVLILALLIMLPAALSIGDALF